MRRNQVIGVLVGTIVLIGLGSTALAVNHTFNTVRRSLTSKTHNTQFKMEKITPEQQEKNWQEMKQNLTEAGITLTPNQEPALREAANQLGNDMYTFFQDNPVGTIAQLIAAASLPQPQGEAMMKVAGLDQKLGTPIVAYRTRVLNALTPEQRTIWEERIWNRQQTQPTQKPQITLNPPDPVEEARQWEAQKQKFREAGVPLSPQQEIQIQTAFTKLRTGMTQEIQADSVGAFGRLIAVAMLPAPITETFAKDLLSPHILTYWRSIDQTLTPQQKQIWDREFSNRNQS